VEFCANFPANSWDIIRGLSPYDWDDLLGAGMNAPARAIKYMPRKISIHPMYTFNIVIFLV
jgi:hypothetical protein